jgi:predicted TIM-barrel enzyme
MNTSINDRNAILLTVHFPKEGLIDGNLRITVEKFNEGKALEVDFSDPDSADAVFLLILENVQFGALPAPV